MLVLVNTTLVLVSLGLAATQPYMATSLVSSRLVDVMDRLLLLGI